MNAARWDALHREAANRHRDEECDGCKVGRNGLVWLIHSDRIVPGNYYRHRIEVEVIDHGVSFGSQVWSVPDLNDPAYVRCEVTL